MSKVALAMICKGSKPELKKLSKCLRLSAQYVDGIFIYVNAPQVNRIPKEDFEKVATKYNAVLSYGTWDGNFGAARRASFEMVPADYSWILWLDADDALVHGSEVKAIADKASAKISGIYVNYEYDVDDKGNVVTEHAVARLVRNDGSFNWSNKLVHETLEPVRRVSSVSTDSFCVRHYNSDEDKQKSLERNIELLERELDGEGGEPDARTLYYLATHYIDVERYDEAEPLLIKYLELSGWDDERAQAHIYLGRMASDRGQKKDARQHFLWAVDEAYKTPNPYYELGIFYLNEGDYKRAIYWLEWCAMQKKQMNTIAGNPLTQTYFSYLGLAIANRELGGANLERALRWVDEALKYREDDLALGVKDEIEYALGLSAQLDDFLVAFKKADKDTQVKMLGNVPNDIRDNPLIWNLRNNTLSPVEWPDKSIVIYVGNSVIGQWGPWSLKDGVGGSEEAVIRISRQLKQLGWDVTIYGTPLEKARDYDGVHWRNYWEFPKFDKFNALVVWRQPEFFDYDHNAKRAYLWMHDVDAQEEFTEERLSRIDKVLLLSQYHREIFPNIPDNKVLLSANGIDPDEFNLDVVRDPHKVIYTSSHVRGLDRLYDIWPEVKEAVPDATLDVFYGWHSYDKITGDNPERKAWKENMIRLADELEGVTDHGKVGQDRIVEEMMSAGVWAYPTHFDEIFCITATKAQAAGAIPVISDRAALKETTKYGVIEDFDSTWNEGGRERYLAALVDMLNHPEKQDSLRPDMIAWAKNNWSWRKVAEQWVSSLTE